MIARATSLGLATLAAAAAWLSTGLLAVTGEDARLRVGVLPPVWLLGVIWIALAGATWLRRIPPARLAPLVLTALLVLPWVPGAIPPAFLIWYGPLAAVVWGFVAAGLVLSALPPAPARHLFRDPRRAPGR